LHTNFTNTIVNQFADTSSNSDNSSHDWTWIECVVCVLTETNNVISEFVPQKKCCRQELMSYLVHTKRYCDIIHMGLKTFINLCQRIRGTRMVKETFWSTAKEQVAKYLHIIGHNVKNQSVSFFFHWSGETMSRHVHNVLKEILMLQGEFLIQPVGTEVEAHILNNNRFFPYFKVWIWETIVKYLIHVVCNTNYL